MTERLFSMEFEGDLFLMERRPHRPHIIINDDYRGLRVIDPFKGEEVLKIPYGGVFTPDGIANAWAVCADGDHVVAFNDEVKQACLLSLESESVQPVSHPPWTATAGMPYDWRGDVLWMKDPDAFAFALFDVRSGRLEADDGMRALQTNRAWRRAIDRMRRLEASCLRVEPELAQALTIANAVEGTRIGRIGWVEQSEPQVPVADGVTRLATVGDSFVVLYEYECVVFDLAGNAVRRMSAPTGFHYVDVVSFSSSANRPPAVIVAAQAIDGRSLARIDVHPL